MSSLGLFFALVLVVANKYFKVEEDPRVEKILGLLAGANCGACGYAGCHDYAQKVVEGEAPANGCPVSGSEVASQIAQILGVEHQEVQPQYAFVHCEAKGSQKTYRADYNGVEDCHAALMVAGGYTACVYACLGFGNCARVCPFGAIKMIDGLPHIDYERCTGCGNCVKACPRNIISLEPKANKRDYRVACSSHDRGKEVKKVCPVGCIACRICEKNCPVQAIHIDNNLAVIDYTKCKGCGICAKKCPQSTILQVD